MRKLVLLAGACLLGSAGAYAQETMIDDFSGGVTAVSHPFPGVAGTWYDIQANTFGTPSAQSGAMRVDDGGFGNGVYAIYNSVVPSTNNFTLAADISIVEETGNTEAVDQIELGCVVNGAHRVSDGTSGDGSTLAAITTFGSYSGLTTGDDTANPPQMVETGLFAATIGDDILVAVGTDVQTTAHSVGSADWDDPAGGDVNYLLVDNVRLRLNGLPVELDMYSVD